MNLKKILGTHQRAIASGIEFSMQRLRMKARDKLQKHRIIKEIKGGLGLTRKYRNNKRKKTRNTSMNSNLKRMNDIKRDNNKKSIKRTKISKRKRMKNNADRQRIIFKDQ